MTRAPMSEKIADKLPTKRPRSFGKADMRYWKQGKRLFRQRRTGANGLSYEDPHYSCRVMFQGKRRQFPLDTSNKEVAASKAAQIYAFLSLHGWDETLEKFCPRPEKREATVGDLIRTASSLSTARPESLDSYAKAFRRVVAGAFKVTSKGKYDAKGSGSEEWRAKIDRVKLSKISPSKITKWKKSYLDEQGTTPAKAERAAITVNSLIRNARSLFSKKILPFLEQEIELPTPLPFEGVHLEREPSRRYQSKIDAGRIIREAAKSLPDSDPEVYKLLLLCLILGLRRSEADMLTWAAFDFRHRKVTIETTIHHRLKSSDSAGEIDLDSATSKIFEDYFSVASENEFVLDSEGQMKSERRGYRCDPVHRRLIDWLKVQGVDSLRPIHTLRKEVGAMIASDRGIYAASRYLRHADIRITSAYYADQKKPLSVDLTELMTAPEEDDEQ